MSTNIYIIRHAEAEGNIFRRMDGHYNSRITKNGYRQIAALQQRFRDISIDAVYASDLFRTCETAKALYVPKGLPLHRDARFREILIGEQEDYTFGWLEYFTPVQMHNFTKAPELWMVPGAETYLQATDRFLSGLRELGEKHEGQTIAVFSHGGITGWAMRRLFADAAQQAGRCDNTGVCLLRWDSGAFVPAYFYDNSHLPEEISTLGRQKWWRGTDRFNLWFRAPAEEDADLYDPGFPPGGGVQRIAMRAAEPVGYLSYDPGSGEIGCLYLRPEHRGIRMGDQLVGEIVCACRAAGQYTLHAAVDPENKAVCALLERHGAQIQNGRATMETALPEY